MHCLSLFPGCYGYGNYGTLRNDGVVKWKQCKRECLKWWDVNRHMGNYNSIDMGKYFKNIQQEAGLKIAYVKLYLVFVFSLQPLGVFQIASASISQLHIFQFHCILGVVGS